MAPYSPNLCEENAKAAEKARREEESRRELDQAGALLKTAWEKGEISDPEWRARLVALFTDMAVFGEEAPDYNQGKAFLEKAGLVADNAPFRLLVRLKVFHEDENLDLYRYQVPGEFSPEARSLALAHSAERQPDPYEQRRLDLTRLETLTIDGERTRDFDDALSLEAVDGGWRLGVTSPTSPPWSGRAASWTWRPRNGAPPFTSRRRGCPCFPRKSPRIP